MGIIRNNGEAFDLKIPVCVIGAGGCGLTAAVAAANDGAQVAVFESDSSPAGSTAMTIGLICAAGTKQQAALGIEDSSALLFDDILAATREQTDADLAHFLAEESGPTMDWLCEDIGCDFTLETGWLGYGHSVARCHGTPNRNGEEIIAMLMKAASEAGVDIVTSTAVTSLIVNDKEEITGIACNTPDGEMKVGCDALVLASSGFGANREMVKKFIPEMANAYYHGCDNHRGDAVIWGEALGARIADLGSFQGVGTLTPFGFGVPHSLMIEGGFKVNAKGQRFENELENISTQTKTVLAQPGGTAWIIYDQKIHDKTAATFGEYGDHELTIERACKAETIEAIARKTNMPKEALRETFASVTDFISKEATDEFCRDFSGTRVLEQPFYAIKVTGALFHTQGGLCIDRSARVQRKAGGSFPNLFAGGGAARSVSGPAEWGYLPAIGLATAVTFGRIAGREAAKLVIGERERK